MILLSQGSWFSSHAEEMPLLKSGIYDNPSQSQSIKIDFTEEEKAWLKAHPVIRFGSTGNYEPYVIKGSGAEPSGTLVDFLREFNRRLGTNITLEVNPETYTLAQEKELDGILGVVRENAEAYGLLTTRSYFSVYNVVFTRSDAPFTVKSLDDLIGKSVALVGGENSRLQMLAPYGERIHIIPTTSDREALEMVFSGKADAMLGMSLHAYLITKYNLSGIIPAYVMWDKPVQAFMGVRSDWPELISILNKGIDSFSDDEMNAMVAKWLIQQTPPEKPAELVLSVEEKKWLKEHPVITLGGGIFPPLDFVDEGGKAVGIGPDYTELLARLLGIKVNYLSGNLDEMKKMLEEKKIDGLRALHKTLKREEYYNFVGPYTSFQHAIFVPKNTEGISTLEDLYHKRVGVLQGAYVHLYLGNRYPDIDVVPYQNYGVALHALANHDIEAFVGSSPVVSYYVSEHFITELKMVGLPAEMPRELYIVIRKDWPELAGMMNKALATVSSEQHRSINKKWMVLDFYIEPPTKKIAFSATEQAWLAEHNTIRLGIAPSWAPFEYVDPEGEYAGVMSDVVRLLNERLKVSMTPVSGITWSTMLDKAVNGEIDVISAIVRTPEREQYLHFTQPYLELPLVIITRKDSHYIRSLDDLTNSTIAVVRGYVQQHYLERDYPMYTLMLFDDLAQAIDAVSQGKANALIEMLPAVEYAERRMGITNLRVSAPTSYRYEISFAVRKDWPEFINILNKELSKITDSEKSLMIDKWVNVQIERTVDWQRILLITGAMGLLSCLVIGVVLYSNRRLAAEIEQHKQTEAELHKAKKAADEARRWAEAAQKASEVAQRASEAANRAKSEFLANMSHELRTPMNAILGFAQLMQRDSELTAAQHENLGIISRSGEHLLKLINDVLDMSKIEAGRITLNTTSFDLWQTLASIEEMIRVRAEKKGLSFTVTRAPEVPRYINTDESKLRQVLINLLGNAVKFTEKGSVKLQIAKCELRNEPTPRPSQEGESEIRNLKFEIEDTGPGIVPEEVETIFETFGRTQYSQTSKEGTGLGLAISRKFVQLMGGDIHVESEVGKGSVFSFEIRVEPVEMTEIQATQPVRQVIGLEPNQPEYRILVVEDTPESRMFLTQLLQSVGFTLREATNGQEALDLYHEWQPHLIWMDMRMPVIDGYEATKRIRNEELRMKNSDEKTVIIALTSSAFEEDKAEILALGCDEFIRKPVKESEIFETISKHLGVRYVYEKEEKSKVQSPKSKVEDVLTPEALAALPSDLLANLEQECKRSDLQRIFALIDEIRSYDTTVADALTRLAENFNYDAILRFIREAKEKNYKD